MTPRAYRSGNFRSSSIYELADGVFPQLKRFSHLSPVPGFRRWLMQRLAEGTSDNRVVARTRTLNAMAGAA